MSTTWWAGVAVAAAVWGQPAETRFVDPVRGDDAAAGTEAAPLRTIQRALDSAPQGAIVVLRGGTYRENVAFARVAHKEQPFVVRGHPGEIAILDGGLGEFFDSPATAWEATERPGEWRSAKSYPHLRDVVGRFGDSTIGLHTYHHAIDLRATNERWRWAGPDPKTCDVEPVWCGPGLWYDRDSGRIHVRLAHTQLPTEPNYRGETDPRKLPLVVAPFRSTPLTLDGARHVRFENLTIRGGGHDTVILRQCDDVTFDDVVVQCGVYGLRASGVRGLTIRGCAFRGSVPPCCFRADTSLRAYPGRPHRDVVRFGTHALLVPDAGREFDVFAYPLNDDWDISASDFSDAHDGVYLGGVGVRFRRNRVHRLQDDGLYLSPMYRRFLREPAVVEVTENLIGPCLTALAFGGPETGNTDRLVVARNIVAQTEPIRTARPSDEKPAGGSSFGQIFGDHGSPPWSCAKVFQNTFVARDARQAAMAATAAAHADRPRAVFNNLFLHLGKLPGPAVPDAAVVSDGNAFWAPGTDAARGAALFAKVRKLGFETKSLIADPQLATGFDAPTRAASDWRLGPQSPLVNAGVDLPATFVDPRRAEDAGRPDIGALPLGAAPLRAGR